LQQSGCQRVLVPAITAQYFDRLLAFKKIKPSFVDIALGLHPYFLNNHEMSHLDTLEQLVKTQALTTGGFIHGFSGSKQQAGHYLDAGFTLGLGGALTHQRAKAMHKLVAYLPDNGFVLETDSPDMPPSFAKGLTNTPLNIPRIAEHIALLRGQSVQQVLQLTIHNYQQVFKKSGYIQL
jgi:Tat protein secretion system quality control protein TatD with DNase activity